MKQLIIIRILSDLSLLFTLCYYLLSFIGAIELYSIIYLIICFMTFVVYRLRKDSKKKAYIFAVLFFGNFILAKTIADIIFIAVLLFYSMYLALKGLDETSYYLIIDRFNKGLIIIASMFAIAIPTHSLDIIETRSIPFIIIFLVTSVMLTRSLRLLQYNENTEELNKINMKYSIIVIGLSFILSIRQVRQLISGALLRIYDYLLEAIVFILYGAFLAVGHALKYVVAFLKSLIEGKRIMEQLEIQGSSFESIEDINTQSLIEAINRSWIFNIIMKVILSLLVLLSIYYIVKIMMKNFYDKKEEEEYTETKEFIKRDKDDRSSRRWAVPFKPRRYDEYIRYYYQKFIKLCLDRKIDIRNTDTTLQISGKSSGTFDPQAVDWMRETYVKVRYGGDSGNKQTTKEFHDNYKKLKKGQAGRF